MRAHRLRMTFTDVNRWKKCKTRKFCGMWKFTCRVPTLVSMNSSTGTQPSFIYVLSKATPLAGPCSWSIHCGPLQSIDFCSKASAECKEWTSHASRMALLRFPWSLVNGHSSDVLCLAHKRNPSWEDHWSPGPATVAFLFWIMASTLTSKPHQLSYGPRTGMSPDSFKSLLRDHLQVRLPDHTPECSCFIFLNFSYQRMSPSMMLDWWLRERGLQKGWGLSMWVTTLCIPSAWHIGGTKNITELYWRQMHVSIYFPIFSYHCASCLHKQRY